MGVKSFGWENSTAQESPIQSWNLMGPSVVCASKSGAVSPICNPMVISSSSRAVADGSAYAALSASATAQRPPLALARCRYGDDKAHEDLHEEVGVRPGARAPQPARA